MRGSVGRLGVETHRRGVRARGPRRLRVVRARIGRLPPAFTRVVDRVVASRTRTFGATQRLSEQALREREERLTEVYLAGRMTKAEYDRRWHELRQQRTSLSVAPAPLRPTERKTGLEPATLTLAR